jgi:hypothetical protein
MSSIGNLVVKIGADISGIRKDSKRGADALGGMQRSTAALGTALKALAIGLVVRKLSSMVKESLAAIDANAKLARQLGGTINGLQGLKLAASEAGVSSGALRTAAEMLNRRLGEVARRGAGEAANALKRLGLDARELSQMDLDERMATIADAMRDAGLSSQGMADILGQLGIRQAELVRLMLDGGDAIRAGKVAIDEMGLSLTELDAAKVEAANDAMDRVRMASKAISQQLAVALSPILTVISKKFLSLTGDTAAVQSAVKTMVDVAVTGFGFIGDAIRGVHIVFKTLELAGWAWGTAYIEIFRFVAKGISWLIDKGIDKANELIEAFNLLPGIDITPVALTRDSKFMKGLDDLSAGMRATVKDVFGQLQELATKEWPSSQAKKFLAEVQAAAEAAAVAVVETRNQISGGEGGGGPTEAEAKEEQKMRERLERQLEILREHSMTTEELENARHASRLEQLNAALEAELVTLADFARISEGIEKKHMDALAEIRKKGLKKTQDLTFSSVASGVKQITGMLANLTASAARENKTMFDVHKAFAIADAAVSGAMGVAQTMGAYPFPVNVAFAAAHGAMAAAQIGIIASKQFEGGNRSVAAPAPAVPATGGGGAGTTTTGAGGGGITGGRGQLTQINLEGDNFSRSTVLSLIEQINEAVGDGARIEIQ